MNKIFKRDRTPIFIIIPVFLLLLAGGAGDIFPGNFLRYLIQICLYTVLGEAFNLLSGYAGMTSLGQQLYVGVAGYTAAIVSERLSGSVFPAIAAAVLISALLSLLLSFILFRMNGMYFAIASWVAAEAFRMLFLSWKFTNQGGGKTLLFSPYPSLKTIYVISLVICILSIVLIWKLLSTKQGLALKTMRDDPEAASSIGVDLARTRLIAYLLAAVLSALAGAMFFINKGMIYPDSGFSVSWTVAAVFICIIGGTGTVTGPLAGSVLYVVLREILAHYPGWSGILLGIITILVIFFLPEGIVGTVKKKIKAKA